MKKWGFGEWFAIALFTWWIPFSIYGYFTREDAAVQARQIPKLTQEEKSKVYVSLCADARRDAQRPGLEPREFARLSAAADAVCNVTLPLANDQR